MAVPIRDLRSREISELPRNGTKTFRFRGVHATDLTSGEMVDVLGPVDLARYGSCTFEFTDRETGVLRTAQGLCLLVSEENGAAVDRELRVVSTRLVEQLHADLESGAYRKTRYTIEGVGEPPKTRYGIPTRELVG